MMEDYIVANFDEITVGQVFTYNEITYTKIRHIKILSGNFNAITDNNVLWYFDPKCKCIICAGGVDPEEGEYAYCQLTHLPGPEVFE